MPNATGTDLWPRLVLILLLLLPLLVLFFLPGSVPLIAALWFVPLLVFTLALLWMLLARSPATAARDAEPDIRMLSPEEIPPAVQEMMRVRLAIEQDGVRIFRGRLLEPEQSAYQKLKQAFTADVVPLLQQDEQFGSAILLMPRPVEQAMLEHRSRPAVHWLLFGLTILTTTWAGAVHQGINLFEEPERFTAALPYALGLLTILGIHELGHYFTARHYGMRVTPPYFIPVPFALGTFGAFIQMKSPTETRKMLFDVAIAGPLAGLVVAIPALVIGLQNSEVLRTAPSEVGPGPISLQGTAVSWSVLLAVISKLVIPEALEQGCVLRLSPLAFAGWLGFLVTALNLIPVGQLDGGHMARGMFGSRTGAMIGSIAMWSLLLLGLFVWQGLLLWAIIVFFIAGRGTPPLNDLTPISPARRLLGFATFGLLVLILMPVPAALLNELGIRCPYV